MQYNCLSKNKKVCHLLIKARKAQVSASSPKSCISGHCLILLQDNHSTFPSPKIHRVVVNLIITTVVWIKWFHKRRGEGREISYKGRREMPFSTYFCSSHGIVTSLSQSLSHRCFAFNTEVSLLASSSGDLTQTLISEVIETFMAGTTSCCCCLIHFDKI